MKKYSVIAAFFFTLFFCSGQTVSGQEEEVRVDTSWEDAADTLLVDSAAAVELSQEAIFAVDTLVSERPVFQPDPGKAVWYALVCPGLGQIYNRSYWKVPILYGGVVTLTYLITWNGRMYNDYRNAYHDLKDGDERYTNSQLLLTSLDESVLKNRRDYYRRNRDLSVFGIAVLYLVSVVDAFVDAQLYNFSISDDLSLQVEPVINNFLLTDTHESSTFGFKCTINF